MKPSLLLYCQHSVGMGHLARSLALARALRERFAVTLACGGALPAGIEVPGGIELLELPPYAGGTPNEDRELMRARRDLLLETATRTRPAVLLIELFPFGRKKFANELLPLIRFARRQSPAALVACSLRDILVAGRRGQSHHDDRAAWLCNRYFDRVLIHSDPRLAKLEDSFAPPRQVLRTACDYTGYVAPAVDVRSAARGAHILVSAGGGLVGLPLFTRVLHAHGLQAAESRRPLRIVAGPFLPDEQYRQLTLLARQFVDVQLLRVVPDLAREMQAAAASISQCGYNTAMDIAASRTPALVAPYVTPTETEQMQRALRLQALGVLDVVDLRDATDSELIGRLCDLGAREPRAVALDLDGAGTTARLLARLTDDRAEARREHAA